MAKRTTKQTTTFYRVNESLSGADLQTYTGAVFLILGMLLPKSKGVRPNAITSFYNSGSIIRHHTGNGNFLKVDGKITLTPKGKKHFQDRITNESINKKEIASLAKALRTGKDLPTEWKGEVELSEITVAK